ncbi:fumarylacetoacetate (FAA) hydrolase [Marinithermofilum abyssi]|uniref:Fumarylacetoacetate (FAA) hydrolase n=1 Tax=Marinithermofilum abyssi TaxID=1571185 RepID=A0A8J2YBZ3_9BACL|nr:fumarylacetoacetate hydrolase family protein [Marinithermofilum abyssi]GGE29371.1 fumarylacetoacetate (FAA) hydrolase [Marinithermofilum abyssi]
MKIIRMKENDGRSVLGVWESAEQAYPLPFEDFTDFIRQAEDDGIAPSKWVRQWIRDTGCQPKSIAGKKLLVPVEAPEVWAAGVTYEKSREARNYEAAEGETGIQTFYDKVYDAKRPELFFKSTAARTVGPDEPVWLRRDSNWQIPEPELGLVLSQRGKIVGYTIGNDMSCRDIEGENPLYLPQAKIWRNSCSIGPAVRLAETVEDPYALQITCRIYRDGMEVMKGTATTGQLKRKFCELVEYLVKDNILFDGTVLLTGTSIVPPNDFTLADGDRIDIEIDGIGVLSNPVKMPVKEEIAHG